MKTIAPLHREAGKQAIPSRLGTQPRWNRLAEVPVTSRASPHLLLTRSGSKFSYQAEGKTPRSTRRGPGGFETGAGRGRREQEPGGQETRLALRRRLVWQIKRVGVEAAALDRPIPQNARRSPRGVCARNFAEIAARSFSRRADHGVTNGQIGHSPTLRPKTIDCGIHLRAFILLRKSQEFSHSMLLANCRVR